MLQIYTFQKYKIILFYNSPAVRHNDDGEPKFPTLFAAFLQCNSNNELGKYTNNILFK